MEAILSDNLVSQRSLWHATPEPAVNIFHLPLDLTTKFRWLG